MGQVLKQWGPASISRALGPRLRGLIVGVAVAVAGHALAQTPPLELSPQRWRENARGLSLRPPQGAGTEPHPDEDGLVRFVGPGPIRVEVFLKQNPRALNIEQIIEESIRQFAMACPSAKILDQSVFCPADRPPPTDISDPAPTAEPAGLLEAPDTGELMPIEPAETTLQMTGPDPDPGPGNDPAELPGVPGVLGGVVDFAVPDPKGNLYVGQAFLPLGPHELVMLQWTSPLERDGSAQRQFRAVLASLEVQDPNEISGFRSRRIESGQAWREHVTPERLRAAATPKQWFRVIENNRDVGYMRVTCRPDEQLGHAGLLIETEAHWSQGPYNFDLASEVFTSDDGAFESWSIRTAARNISASKSQPHKPHNPSRAPNDPTAQPPDVNATVWAQTGVRSGEKISVTIDRPAGVKNLKWEAPPRGYLSQVEVYLLGPMLADRPVGEMGFYAYCPSTEKLAFRTEQVDRKDDGSYTLRSRPSPDLDEQTADFGPDGRLIRRVLPGGRVLLPTTESQLALLWKIGP